MVFSNSNIMYIKVTHVIYCIHYIRIEHIVYLSSNESFHYVIKIVIVECRCTCTVPCFVWLPPQLVALYLFVDRFMIMNLALNNVYLNLITSIYKYTNWCLFMYVNPIKPFVCTFLGAGVFRYILMAIIQLINF